MRGDVVSGGGTFGAAATSYGSSGGVARSVVDGGGTFGAAAIITRRCVYKIIFQERLRGDMALFQARLTADMVNSCVAVPVQKLVHNFYGSGAAAPSIK